MHVMGCGLFIIPTIAKETYDFRGEEGLLDKSVGLQYMFGIYWAAMVSHTLVCGLQLLTLVTQLYCNCDTAAITAAASAAYTGKLVKACSQLCSLLLLLLLLLHLLLILLLQLLQLHYWRQ